jgi:hypothetical protein
MCSYSSYVCKQEGQTAGRWLSVQPTTGRTYLGMTKRCPGTMTSLFTTVERPFWSVCLNGGLRHCWFESCSFDTRITEPRRVLQVRTCNSSPMHVEASK